MSANKIEVVRLETKEAEDKRTNQAGSNDFLDWYS